MKFIIIYKKDDENEIFDDSFLSSTNAPSLISNKCIKRELSNFIVYLYTYNQIYEEDDSFYKFDDDNIYFYNGLISIKDIYKSSVTDIFSAINDNELILGDFQAIQINNEGNCYIKTSDSSIYPLFYYEDEHCIVLANEIKLIVDGINAFRKPFVNNYDYDFIEDIFYNGFFYKEPKKYYRKTIFKNIKRILPHDDVNIEKGNLNIQKNSNITIPKWFEEWYLEDKDSLYDWYYDNLLNYTETLLQQIASNIDDIRMGITGGFDSRITLMVLNKFCKKYNFKINTFTSGSPHHPDVVIGGKVANALNVSWEHRQNVKKFNLKQTPQNFQYYASTFYESQGDFDSHDYITNYSRSINNSNSFFQNGMDVYKRDTMSSIINFNRWFSRRILFRSNFYFPLLSTNFELWFSRIYEKYHKGEDFYKEFVYYVLKKGNNELLEIPFAFNSLPQLDIKEYTNEFFDSTNHKLEPFLWDYTFVYNELDPVFKEKYDEFNIKHDLILSKSGINSLDYFLLKKEIEKTVLKNDKNIKKLLISLKNNAFYPLNRSYINLDNCSSTRITISLMKLMDYASAASFNSFVSLETYANFNLENYEYDSKEEIYKEYNNLRNSYNDLNKKYSRLKKLNKDIISSRSYKLVLPLKNLKKFFMKLKK